MSYPDGFWTFVDQDGEPYGSLAVDHQTSQQAWADFYEGDSKRRREAERKGWSCRPARPDDLERMKVGSR